MGNSRTLFAQLGANGSEEREINDFYATDPKATEWLLKIEEFDKNIPIWEPCCGQGHISETLRNNGYKVYNTDIIDRGYEYFDEQLDFLTHKKEWDGNIITNPPYSLSNLFVYKAIETLKPGRKLAMFLKLTFLETKGRRDLFKKYPPKTLWCSSGRLGCAKHGDFKRYSQSGIAYGWYIWEKGYKGDPIIKWFN